VITLVISAIVLGLGVPSLWAIIQDNRLTAQANDFISDAFLTRSEAVKRSRRVTMCRCVSDSSGQCVESSGDYTCDTSDATNWNVGWIVFEDVNEDAEHDGGTEEIIRVHDRLPLELDLTGNDKVKDYISYDRRGMSTKADGTFQNGTLCVENANQETASGRILKRVITLNTGGRITTCNPNSTSCGACP
jgi:type IV fimbrial biogenesis protein FimT